MPASGSKYYDIKKPDTTGTGIRGNGPDPLDPNKYWYNSVENQEHVRSYIKVMVRNNLLSVENIRAGTCAAPNAAVEVGYSDQSHMTREIRSLAGITPARLLQYRAQRVPRGFGQARRLPHQRLSPADGLRLRPRRTGRRRQSVRMERADDGRRLTSQRDSASFAGGA